ncbi:hypothetical protein MUS1_13135 [Marinomonas ushuaiensis DSM 15871]|uniref:CDP-glycerol glycerophosphotransferase n=2 Tax=Marinomonas TaxID=28253 RepID=X7E4R9_9GAMM|nr:hypothetical protein MUS1_13135 [Marinomonas ushuaiensis DSM 15871]
MNKKYLFYITKNYSFEILRPLQEAILSEGDDCFWYAHGNSVNKEYFNDDEKILKTIDSVIEYEPDAVFVPGNVVPHFIPGLKVQIFHGLEHKKKGHFIIRGFFDLYCTHGPITTEKFNELADKYKSFEVIETGWPKLDPLFHTEKLTSLFENQLPCVLYAPTFSISLTSSVDLLIEIENRVKLNKENWLFKFHPKMSSDLLMPYKDMEKKYRNVVLINFESISPSLQTADILLSDTSSVIGEFLLLNKPVITYRNIKPGAELINFDVPEKLGEMISLALNPSTELQRSMVEAVKQLHPYVDGVSSFRILKAVKEMLLKENAGIKRKPWNIFRKFQQRKGHNFWKF